jgi:hypothetical protein
MPRYDHRYQLVYVVPPANRRLMNSKQDIRFRAPPLLLTPDAKSRTQCQTRARATDHQILFLVVRALGLIVFCIPNI